MTGITSEQLEKICKQVNERGGIYQHASVIILTHNRDVEPILNIWKEQHGFQNFFEIVIVEGGTTDRDILERNRDYCLRNHIKRRWVSPKHGKDIRGVGRNYGAAHAEGSYLIFVDGDCYPLHEFSIAEFLSGATENAILCGNIFHTCEPPSEEILGDHREPWMNQNMEMYLTYDPWMMHEQAFMVDRARFISVGGFETDWSKSSYCFEGIDLYFRLFLQYFTPIMLLPRAAFVHEWHEKSEDAKRTRENLPLLVKRIWEIAKPTSQYVEANLVFRKMLAVLDGEGEERFDIR